LRIIGGELKRRKLGSLRGTTIRPTADRLREAIFNILSPDIRGAVVLDLFAGTGALGIEALSRGAKISVFIDKDKEALSLIKKNISLCGLDKRSKIVRQDITRSSFYKGDILMNVLNDFPCPEVNRKGFNLIFLDPPYGLDLVRPSLQGLSTISVLAKNANLIIEHSCLEPIPDEMPEYNISDQRRYGKTLVTFLKYVI